MEGYGGKHYHRQPNHRKCIFPTQETRVEETDAWNHDPHKGGGGEDPSNVAQVIDDILLGVRVKPYERPGC